MAKANPATIILNESPYKEGIAGEAITPGQLVEYNATLGGNSRPGFLRHNGTGFTNFGVMVAVEKEALVYDATTTGDYGEITDAYASGDLVRVRCLRNGDEFYGLVAAAAAAITVGAALQSDGDGNVAIAGTPPAEIGSSLIALQAVDNSGGGSPARIRVAVVG